jgi:hypothetical protein
MPYDETIRYVSEILNISYEDAKRALLPGGGAVPADPSEEPIALPALGYNPDVPYGPEDAQWDEWTCSIHTAQQALESVDPSGIWTYDKVYRYMTGIPVVDSNVGFYDRTGGLFVNMFQILGYESHNVVSPSFAFLMENAGHEPICLSLWGMYHWVFVRKAGVAADGTPFLHLSNSADGYLGVGQTLNESQFNRFTRNGQDCAAVFIDLPYGESAVAIAELQAQLQYFINARAYLVNDVIIGRAVKTGMNVSRKGTVKAAEKTAARAEFQAIEAEALRVLNENPV